MPIRDRDRLIAEMAPRLHPEVLVFCTTADRALLARLAPEAFGTFREAEGWTLILPPAVAVAEGLACSAPMQRIELSVDSDLEGVGLTAAVATALAAVGIPCNVVAAYHHDHVFVPAAQATRAVRCLERRALSHSRPG